MLCPKCGYQNEDDSQFCINCGKEIPQGSQEPEETTIENIKEKNPDEIRNIITKNNILPHTMPMAKILKIAVPVVAAVIVIALIIVISMPGNSNYITAENSIMIFSSGGDTVVSGNNNAKFTINGLYYSSQFNTDNSKAVILTDYNEEIGGTLWYVTVSDKSKIADDVYNYVFSVDGSGVAYLTDYDYNSSSMILYLYDCENKSKSKVSGEAAAGAYCSISPNGKTVGYAEVGDSKNGDFVGYIRQEGKNAEKLGTNIICFAVADNAKYIYYMKYNVDTDLAALYVRSGNNDEVKLGSDLNSKVFFNIDYSQMLFNYDGKIYISINGKDRQKIANSAVERIVLPQNTFTSDSDNLMTCGIKDFAGNHYISNGNVMYIDKKYEASKIVSVNSYYSTVITSDGKNVIFTDNSNRLCKINAEKTDSEKIVIGEDVINFVSSGNGSTIYFVNKENELWCVKGGGRPVKISDDVYSTYLAMMSTSNRVFFLMDYQRNIGILYYSDNGGKKVKVASANEVAGVRATPSSIFYYANYSEKADTYDVYRSNGNEKFSKFEEDVSSSYMAMAK